MAEKIKRTSFVFYESFFDSIEELPKETQADILIGLVKYGLRGEIDEDISPVAKALLMSFKPQIDKNNQRYMNGFKGAEYGIKGGKREEQNPKPTPTEPQPNPKPTPNVNDNVNDNVNVITSIEDRKLKFSLSLKKFESEYPVEMLVKFYNYWTEPNRSGTKFRAENEKTWDLAGRLRTWADKQKEWTRNQKPADSRGIQSLIDVNDKIVNPFKNNT